MLSTTPGRSYPIGATICAEGVHFCVYSKHATSVELVLFDHETDGDPAHIIRLDAAQNGRHKVALFEAGGISPIGRLVVSRAIDIVEDRSRQPPPRQAA